MPPPPHRLVEEMAELVGGLAHELRNPLSTMMLNLTLLAEELQDPNVHAADARRRAVHRVETVRTEAARLNTLFNDFLELTRPFTPQRKELDVNAIAARLVEFFEPVAQSAGIELRFEPACEPLRCQADDRLLRQAMLNLMINAQQAMPNGGTLRVTTGAVGQELVIRMSDTGVGIADEDRDRILRPFYSTKAGGTGLGLSITQRIVQGHGGSLSFESPPGGGTTFEIRLPRVQSAPSAD